MGFLKKHIVIAMIAMVLPAISLAVDDLRSQIARTEETQKNTQMDIKEIRETLDAKTKEIEKIKRQESRGIVSKLLLQKKLKEAEAISKELDGLVKDQNRLGQKLMRERSALLTDIDHEIQTLTKNTKEHQLAQLQRLQSLIAEKERLLSLQVSKPTEFAYFNLGSPSKNEKEDLIGKLQVIEDLEKGMQQKIAMLEDAMKEEKSKEFLRNEVSHFIDEENFFGEQSFISNGLNRKDSALNLNGLALRKENSNNVPASAAPATTPEPATGDSASTAAPSTPTTIAPVQITSTSTSFQQPQDLNAFQNLLEQIQASIKENEPNQQGAKTNLTVQDKTTDKQAVKRITKQDYLRQNLALSEKIMTDLNTLHENLEKQIQKLE